MTRYAGRMTLAGIEPTLKACLTRELAAGEHILWSSQPDALISLIRKLPLSAFGLLFTSISVSSLPQPFSGANTLEIIVAALFISVGVVTTSVPGLAYWRARSTLFAITESRLLTLSCNGRRARSMKRSGIADVERVSWRGRLVTLRVPTGMVRDGDGGRKMDFLELEGVRDAYQAYELLTR